MVSENKSQFVSSMSHELRTPLNAIIGLTEMMVTNAARFGTEKAQEPLQRANRAGTHLLGLIMRGEKFENELPDMAAQPAADMARRHPGVIVGIKTAHYKGPEWTPVERAVEAGTLANIPVMVDFGTDHPERPVADLLTKKLRPGDIYTHMYSGLRGEQDASGHVNPDSGEGRKRGVHL